jgi:cation transport regulator ChaC
MMWVFGYGSLMWDAWETEHGCTRRTVADLLGYRRIFNKASIRNWGTKDAPGPTLNLIKCDAGVCRGIAFQFPDNRKTEIFSVLEAREGRTFPLRELVVRLDDQSEISAFVPLYNGKNIVEGKTLEEVAKLVLVASGTSGTCLSYINGIADKISTLGVHDPAVIDLWKAVNTHVNCCPP